MRWIFLLAAAAALIGTSAWLASTSGESRWLPAAASGLVIFAGCLGSFALRRRRERAMRSADPDSVERALAVEVRSATLIDALVAGVAFCACLWVFDLGSLAHVLVTAWLVLVVADFWLRWAIRLDAIRLDAVRR
ncbi:hypothetical protein ES689_14090 [Frigoribacterium sp. ACAM 257]|uniref:hypothetical protein n=1 Tax=Frigoribacterium sp. ACAM 257 TaxID=2508998 RepID=UPI0011BA1CA2|nr:hypothetical protein [Frigoribacterium sp. ACAM 257]TWX34970.1 hypothetical protein ES689_14090 [Frigoribacterium sp. ACAM 257]